MSSRRTMPSNPPSASWIRPYYPAFNGLRGLAILMVFVNHYGTLVMHDRYAMMFWPGVDLFFVLSGFLITGILFDSRQHADYFRGFYIRRALRIFPLYYALFLAIAVLTPILKLSYAPTIWSFLVYAGNIVLVWGNNYLDLTRNPTVIHIGVITSHHVDLTLGHLWSLCVEEQFYLVWPLVVWLLPSRKALLRFSAAAIAFTLCLRIGLYFYDPLRVAQTHFLYVATWTRCEGLFAGSWLALWLRGAKVSASRLRTIAWTLIAACSAVVTIGAETIGKHWFANEVNPLVCTYGYTLIAGVAVGVLLLALDEKTWVHKALLNRGLARLGVVSYGFYLIHEIYNGWFVQTVKSYAWKRRTNALAVVVLFLFTYLAAWLSFHFFEAHFLRLKHKLAPSRKQDLVDEKVRARGVECGPPLVSGRRAQVALVDRSEGKEAGRIGLVSVLCRNPSSGMSDIGNSDFVSLEGREVRRRSGDAGVAVDHERTRYSRKRLGAGSE